MSLIKLFESLANVQEIWALVENNDLDAVSCLGLKQVATLYVEPRPIANACCFIMRRCWS